MQTKLKVNSVITHERLESGAIRFNVRGAGFVDFNLQKVHAANRDYAALHGFIQRISDGAAMSRDSTNGAPASPADKLAAMERLVEHYESGSDQWRLTATGEGGGRSITVEAIAQVQSVDYDTAYARVEAFAAKRFEGDTKKALAFFRDSEKVRTAMDAIKASRVGAPKIDADAALNELQ
jgi:hypothetical protein